MPDRLFRPNPFPGDDGRITPRLAQAYRAADNVRTEQIVAALGRVLVPVIPHEPPKRRDRASIHDEQGADPYGCPDEELVTVDFPGGRKGLPIFSSVDALREWHGTARPVPLDIATVAAAAMQRADGVLTLDEGCANMTWLGRSAVAALASGTAWHGPWSDPQITKRLTRGCSELPGLESIEIVPGASGAAVVVIHLDATANRDDAHNIVHTVAAIIATDSYVRARLDVVEIQPARARVG
ncbi:SseB family protein [Trueperella bialowiezensis]|uniref:SseB protein N-terminal domain-containing protein n=1 Tax=Trueperella bialowiezensis TaxID=312285 RepID=A0A3S4V064_9ACTO|nr:SseB family protein [Trueperella bialowiezensis]VEI14124.1 Uncharacterised protein [Trueperella bialowiezensis]